MPEGGVQRNSLSEKIVLLGKMCDDIKDVYYKWTEGELKDVNQLYVYTGLLFQSDQRRMTVHEVMSRASGSGVDVFTSPPFFQFWWMNLFADLSDALKEYPEEKEVLIAMLSFLTHVLLMPRREHMSLVSLTKEFHSVAR